ncbi:hypothetical protein [Nocardioides bruguierae]|uniref:Zf-HC2 domain-containing protein n=1 Tax=Nocardioides bruguierae TaxID=2945102 RepID=A0A9X2D715_9ACTN|nr:hypothetical protein [Nocardioides bruguierae]MCL8025694.1 hypothetical protein [Nocardioides bruguierae]MCM0620546.1 hypothetical protein [Nocardioides bruguierae]
MIGGHLGNRASALLDGQLPEAEAERWWTHVHGCHACRDLVEREGWVKDRLSGLARTETGMGASDSLKGLLKGGACAPRPGFGVDAHLAPPSGEALLAMSAGLPPRTDDGRPPRPWRHVGLAAGVGGAAGAAVFGFAAVTMGVVPGGQPTPATSVNQPVSQSSTTPTGSSTAVSPASLPVLHHLARTSGAVRQASAGD